MNDLVSSLIMSLTGFSGCAPVRPISPDEYGPAGKADKDEKTLPDSPAACVSNEVYQKLQEAVFGSVIVTNKNDNIYCADIPLDGVNDTSRVELCREVAHGDMEISSSEFVHWALMQDENLLTKYPALGTMEPTNGPLMYFSEELPRQVMETHGVLMNVPLSYFSYEDGFFTHCNLDGYFYYDIAEDIMAVQATNESFRLFWEPDGSTKLELQNVFEVLQKEIAEAVIPEEEIAATETAKEIQEK